ncbi:MAG: NYN domain-containing protein [Candidatus Omnitrophica bacterium]|nr:NYN domain-containing protein [Candidatus Omnitrophota bacterium]
MKYIIDGYNLIHQVDRFKGKCLRSQREGLIRLLESAQRKSRQFKDLTVVFDGKLKIQSFQIHSTVRVVFSRGISADQKIKEIVECSNFARDIAVVSDDREIKFYVGSLGAKKVSVGEFLKKLSATTKKEDAFELGQGEAKRINQELEKIWLPKLEREEC